MLLDRARQGVNTGTVFVRVWEAYHKEKLSVENLSMIESKDK